MKTDSTDAAPMLPQAETWITYRAVWRWHFYAGVFCIPLILWLSVTGSIYLFRPQIEHWLDRPYDSLTITGPRATADAQVMAALAAVPGSNLHSYVLPRTAHSAAQIIAGKAEQEFRVYVQPQTLQIMKVINEDRRPMNLVESLHGELLMGDRGSMIVELAASWAIVMIVTGLYLWWPRQTAKLAGVIYVRLHKGKRIFWRDLHAVTGVWVSAFALFLILTGLPWAHFWGKYLEKVRALTPAGLTPPDWTTGRSSELAKRVAMNPDMPGMTMATGNPLPSAPGASGTQVVYAQLDKLIAVVAPLHLVDPVLLSPPVHKGDPWTVEALPENRTVRATLKVDGPTGAILTREDFGQKPLIDRIVETGVAAHTGQLFGLFNQLLGLFTAIGLILLSISAIVLWWRRRAVGVLGAPVPTTRPRFSFVLVAVVLAFSLYLPLMGGSLGLVLVTEQFALKKIPSVRRWLGLGA